MTSANTSQSIQKLQDINGKTAWKSPSNLAIIKYWGKHGIQLPRNPSISFTLDNAYTETTVQYSNDKKTSANIEITFTFEGKKQITFQQKIERFLESVINEFPFLSQLRLEIESENSFPHSSGIASSASSMSALALCLCSIERHIEGTLQNDIDFLRRASHIARLGSGSASRSVYPLLAVWGKHDEIEESSDLYAVPYVEMHDIFRHFHDDILIVSKKEKSVSSRAGHALMEGNPYAKTRYKQAHDRMTTLLTAFKSGDLEAFGKIAEDEALTLHGMMMCSNPSYMLMEANTIALIHKIRTYRQETKNPLYFSLDAGPNIHLLYPHTIYNEIQPFINDELRPHCEDGKIIEDKVGPGPQKLF